MTRSVVPTDLPRRPKIPARVVPGLPENYQTLIYYDAQGNIFCIKCNLYLSNVKKAKEHCKYVHYKKRVES